MTVFLIILAVLVIILLIPIRMELDCNKDELKNETSIIKGMFASDNKAFWKQVGDVASRFFWQQPQTFLGTATAFAFNRLGVVESVDQLYGATTITTKGILGNKGECIGKGALFGDNWGITIGNTIIGGNNLAADPNNRFFQHEYGHYLQSQDFGPLYLFGVGLPSLSSHGNDHPTACVELDANYRAFNYFNRYVEGFYISPQQWSLSYNHINGWLGYGWNFFDNPLSKIIKYPQDSYVNFYDTKTINDSYSELGVYKSFHF